MRLSHTGAGILRDSLRKWVLWILPEGQLFIYLQATQPWPEPWCLSAEKCIWKKRKFHLQIFLMFLLEQDCFGSDGLDLMQDLQALQVAFQFQHLLRPIQQ